MTDALDAYRAARVRLADEQALEPESRLSELQHAILCADPALDGPLVRHPPRTQLPHEIWSFARTDPLSDEVAVEVRDLSKRYGTSWAVDGISFTARKGEVLGLLGPYGAGKTTILRILSTVVTPTRGQISVGGVPGTRHNEIRKLIGVLPQNAGYPGHQTGLEFLTYHGRLFGLSRTEACERAARLLGQVGLGNRGGARIATFSRDMRQRLGIARALVNDPAVVLLDEPATGLDPPGQRDILTLVRTIAEARGITLLLSAHAAPEVERICTGVLILERGKLASGQVMTT